MFFFFFLIAIQQVPLNLFGRSAGVYVCVLNNTWMATRTFDCVPLTSTQILGHARSLSDLCKRIPSERQLSSRAPYHLSHPLHQISQTVRKGTTEWPSIRLWVFMKRNKNSDIWDGQMVDRSLDMLKVHSFLGYVKLNCVNSVNSITKDNYIKEFMLIFLKLIMS